MPGRTRNAKRTLSADAGGVFFLWWLSWYHAGMADRIIHWPLSGGDRKALKKSLREATSTAVALEAQAEAARTKGEELIRTADRYACEAWNARLWAEGGSVQPSPSIAQAINGGYGWLRVRCSRCGAISGVDLAKVRRPPETPIWRLEGALDCTNCRRSRWRPQAVIVRLAEGPE